MGISKDEWAEHRTDVKNLLKGQAAINQWIQDQKPRCDSHGRALDSLKVWRWLMTGGWVVLAGLLTWCGIDPERMAIIIRALAEHKK